MYSVERMYRMRDRKRKKRCRQRQKGRERVKWRNRGIRKGDYRWRNEDGIEEA